MCSRVWNLRLGTFPVVRESLGYQDALYGFKSGFDPASGALGLKAGGYWPNNGAKGIANHQSSIFLFDPETGQCKAILAGNTITALRTAAAAAVSIDRLAVAAPIALGLVGTGHQSAFNLRPRFVFDHLVRYGSGIGLTATCQSIIKLQKNMVLSVVRLSLRMLFVRHR